MEWCGRQILEVLYPYDCRPPGVSEKENNNADWLKAGHALLRVVTEHLQRLNTENIYVDPAREGGAFAEMLPAPANGSAGAPSGHALPTASEHLQATLDRLARLRRRIADYSAHYNAHLTRLKRALFCLAFASALFFSLADNWDVKVAVLPLPQIFFAAALGLTMAAWVVYFCFKKTAAAERSRRARKNILRSSQLLHQPSRPDNAQHPRLPQSANGRLRTNFPTATRVTTALRRFMLLASWRPPSKRAFGRARVSRRAMGAGALTPSILPKCSGL